MPGADSPSHRGAGRPCGGSRIRISMARHAGLHALAGTGRTTWVAGPGNLGGRRAACSAAASATATKWRAPTAAAAATASAATAATSAAATATIVGAVTNAGAAVSGATDAANISRVGVDDGIARAAPVALSAVTIGTAPVDATAPAVTAAAATCQRTATRMRGGRYDRGQTGQCPCHTSRTAQRDAGSDDNGIGSRALDRLIRRHHS
jgi:hypothetical protein